MRFFGRANHTSPTRLRVEQLEDRTVPTIIPSGFSETVFASGLNVPTAMALAPDGRIFVAEKGGTLRVVQNGVVQSTPFLTVGVNTFSERGLIGVAVDPNFATNGFVYVYYTTDNTVVNRVSRFTASTMNPNVAQTGSEVILLDNIPSTNGNHNGGALAFGADGMLYIGVGEAGVPANSQDLSNLLGKVLRIEPDGDIPADNPTTIAGLGTVPSGQRAIWAAGLRNPFTMAIQPGTGTLFINDVGGGLFEEVNPGVAGANYGWPTTEGDFNQSSFPNFTRPVYAYAHGSGPLQGNSIAGGAFYNPASASFPAEFVGDYFFGEFVRSRIFVRDAATGAVTTFADPTAGGGIVDLDVLPDGRLLYLSLNTGTIYQIAATPPTPQVIAVGTGAGGQAFVAALNPDGRTRFVTPLLPGFSGGVRVASGDLTGDGFEDVVVGLGPGGPPAVGVFNGVTGQLVTAFLAFPANYGGGVSVAVGDVTGDGRADIVVGTATSTSLVAVYDGVTFGLARVFFAAPGFNTGVNVAAGDLDSDGQAEIVVGTASTLSAVGVFSGATGALTSVFLAFGAAPIGVNVAVAGNEIVVGAASGPPVVATFNTAGQARLAFFALPPGLTDGVRVAVQGNLILTGSGPYLVTYNQTDGSLAFAQFAFGVNVPGGVFVG